MAESQCSIPSESIPKENRSSLNSRNEKTDSVAQNIQEMNKPNNLSGLFGKEMKKLQTCTETATFEPSINHNKSEESIISISSSARKEISGSYVFLNISHSPMNI